MHTERTLLGQGPRRDSVTKISAGKTIHPEDNAYIATAARARPSSALTTSSALSTPSAPRSASALGPEASAKVVLSIVKQYPGVAMQLNLPKGFGDQELLKALMDAPSPVPKLDTLLKTQGCGDKTRLRACVLLPMAIQAVVNPPKKPFWSRRRRYACLIMLGIAEVCVLSAALMLWSIRLTWKQGECSLRDFWDAECVQSRAQATGTITACEFDVRVGYSVAGGSRVFHARWSPPATSYYNRFFWDDPPFRCCDDPGLPQRRSCCDLMDVDGNMCDNWPGRFDSSGMECPSGGWPCLFKTAMVNGVEEVTSVDVDRKPPIQELFIAAGAVALVAGCLQLYWVVQRRRHANKHSMTVVQEVTSRPKWEDPDVINWTTPEAWAADPNDPPKPHEALGNRMEAASDLESLPGAVPEPIRLTEVPVPAAKPRILYATSEVSSKQESAPSEDPSGLNLPRSEYANLADHVVLAAQTQPGFLPPRVPRQARGDKARGQTRGAGSTAAHSTSSPRSTQRGTQTGRRSAGRAHSSGRR